MAGGRFSKQAIWRGPLALNANNANDTVIGGLMQGVPAGLNAGQGFQTLPGDRIIFSPSDALAYCNNTIANMYTGTYRYLQFRNNSTANVVRARCVFWDLSVAGAGGNNDGLYQVTADGNAANITDAMPAGIAINNITLNNGTPCYWWIQESGKALVKFIATITGTAAIGAGCYLPLTAPANNNATDNGSVDQFAGANSAAIFTANSTTAYTTVDGMITKYVGVAETLPSNNNISLVDVRFDRGGWRW